MNKHEKAVRDAAATLLDAIVAARKAHLRVEWPANADGLSSIAISETAKADADAVITVVAKGVETGSPENAAAEKAAQKAVNTVTTDK